MAVQECDALASVHLSNIVLSVGGSESVVKLGLDQTFICTLGICS